ASNDREHGATRDRSGKFRSSPTDDRDHSDAKVLGMPGQTAFVPIRDADHPPHADGEKPGSSARARASTRGRSDAARALRHGDAGVGAAAAVVAEAALTGRGGVAWLAVLDERRADVLRRGHVAESERAAHRGAQAEIAGWTRNACPEGIALSAIRY